MKRFIATRIAFAATFCAFATMSSQAWAAVPLRTILLSTNDLNDLGLAPVEGEILYDMVTGGISVHVNGNDVILPQPAREFQALSSEVQPDKRDVATFSVESRTVLVPIGSISSPVEGELGYDTSNSRVEIRRGGTWLPLGSTRRLNFNQFPKRNVSASDVKFRHVLPSVSDVTPVDGELVVDYVNNTVLFKTGSVLKDLKTSSLEAESRAAGSDSETK